MTDEIIIPGAGFEEKFAEADGFNIRYLEAGSGPVYGFPGPTIC